MKAAREIHIMETSGLEQPVCSFCDSKRLGLVMDFGEVGLAGRRSKEKY